MQVRHKYFPRYFHKGGSIPNALQPVFYVEGAFWEASLELPEIALQIGSNTSQKGQRGGFFDINNTYGNAEGKLFFEWRRTLFTASC